VSLRYAYNTNGLADHRLEDALSFLADTGYDGVSLTLDHHHLDPFAPDLSHRLDRLRQRLEDLTLTAVVETGGRFVLDPRRKHEPNLISNEGRQRRVEFLCRAVDIAADLGAETVSFWSGTAPPDVDGEVAWRRLVEGCSAALEAAEKRGVTLAFEPEPGHLVERLDQYDALLDALGGSECFGLTLDVGHCLCVGEESVPERILERAGQLVNVHIEDVRRGVHEHLDFGEGDVDFPPILDALNRIGYRGLVSVELSRHSHAAHRTVPRAIEFLKEAERKKVAV
jgi:sugar phosphate isomerase/epimerase